MWHSRAIAVPLWHRCPGGVSPRGRQPPRRFSAYLPRNVMADASPRPQPAAGPMRSIGTFYILRRMMSSGQHVDASSTRSENRAIVARRHEPPTWFAKCRHWLWTRSTAGDVRERTRSGQARHTYPESGAGLLQLALHCRCSTLLMRSQLRRTLISFRLRNHTGVVEPPRTLNEHSRLTLAQAETS